MRAMRTSEFFLDRRQPGDGAYLPARRRSALLWVSAGLVVAVVIFYFVWFV